MEGITSRLVANLMQRQMWKGPSAKGDGRGEEGARVGVGRDGGLFLLDEFFYLVEFEEGFDGGEGVDVDVEDAVADFE